MQLIIFSFALILFLCSIWMTYGFLTSKEFRKTTGGGRIFVSIFIFLLMGTLHYFSGVFVYSSLFEEKSISVSERANHLFSKYDRNPKDEVIDLHIDSTKNTLSRVEVLMEGAFEDPKDGYSYTDWDMSSIFKDADLDSNLMVDRKEFLQHVSTLDENQDGFFTSTESLWHHWNGITLPEEIKKFSLTYPEYQKQKSR